jgi:membrane-associated protease RseP (regulator of RpoE activity)
VAYLLGVVAFVVALMVSVVLHEAGHFLTAKRFGMKATQFFVGFGPTLWSFRRGETEYGVKAIPAGGFVRIVGYTPLEEIDPADEPRAFYRQPAGQRAVVITAGVVMNFLIAFLLLAALAMTLGERQSGTPTNTVDAVSDCVPASVTATSCRSGDRPSPAARAGLKAGDTIVSLGGVPVHDWTGLRNAIKAQPAGRPVPVVVRRGGQTVQTQVTPVTVGGSTFIGISSKVVGAGYTRDNPIEAAGYAGSTIGRAVQGIGTVLTDLPRAIPKLFSPDRADSAGGQVGSVVGAGEVSGQIFSADVGWRDKVDGFLALVISVNIFLGALNVLPLLPLDGGHLAVVCYERIRVRINELRGRKDPGTVDMTKLLPVTYLVFMILVGLGVLLILADLFNPLSLPQ